MKEYKKNDRFVVMILRFVLCLLLFVFALPAKAQQGFKLGPHAAFITSRTHVLDSLPDNFNFRFKSGLRFGIAAQYGFTPRFVLGSGFNFVNKGYRVYNDTNNNGNLLKHNSSHLELPVNMIFKLNLGVSSRMRFLLGATLNYQISETQNIQTNDKGTFEIREETKHAVYPLMNLGMEIASESKAGNVMVFGVYYSQSFTEQSRLNVYTSSGSDKPYFPLGYRGSYIGFGLSYLFELKNFKREEVFFY